jgi:hypothetical protein
MSNWSFPKDNKIKFYVLTHSNNYNLSMTFVNLRIFFKIPNYKKKLILLFFKYRKDRNCEKRESRNVN